jgi:hypothetical protein
LIQKIQNQYFTQYGCLLDLSYIVAVQSLIQLYLQNKPPEDLLDDQKSNTDPSVYESGFDTTMIGDICSFIQAFY